MNSENGAKLNVGCGRNIIDGWINLDCVNLPGIDIVFDLAKCGTTQIPLNENTIEEFLLSHVLEHIENPLPLMEDLHRIAKPMALCTIRSPFGSSDDAWEDPSHKRPLFLNSFDYFGQPAYWRADYQYRGDWEVTNIILGLSKQYFGNKSKDEILFAVHHYRNVVLELIAILRAVKPIRPCDKHLQSRPNIEIKLI